MGRHRRVLRSDVEAIRTRTDRLSRDERRSLWLGYATAAAIIAEPDRTIAEASRQLERMRSTARGQARSWLDEWQRLIAGPIDNVLAALVDRSLRGRELRQNSPFAGALDDDERTRVLGELETLRPRQPPVNREQLAHIVRSAARITGDGDIVILGSQAILGTYDASSLPLEATMSVEADVAFRNDPDAAKADQVDGAIGELSQFHATYGYYAQGVEISTAVLPDGWEERAEILERPDAYPGSARCLEAHDLVIAKLVAGREKDLTFTVALLAENLVQAAVLRERAVTIDRPGAVIKAVLDRIDRCERLATRNRR